MAKRKTTRRKSTKRTAPAPQHELPTGFWSQVAAVVLMAVAVLLVVSWFGAGGPVLNWILDASLQVIGWAVYVVPFVAFYVAVRVFRVEGNKLPGVMKLASEIGRAHV